MQKAIRALACCVVVVLAGCAENGDSGAPTTTVDIRDDVGNEEAPDPAVAAGAVQTFVDIRSVGVGDDAYVELTNFTDVPVQVGGLHICQGDQCDELPDAELPPGGLGYVVVDGSPDVDGTIILDGASIGDLRPDDGELALFSRSDFDDPTALVFFMEWGSAPHPTTEMALAQGLWVEGSFAPSTPSATELYRMDSGLWLFRES